MFRKALIYFTLPLLLLIGISWKTSGAREKSLGRTDRDIWKK